MLWAKTGQTERNVTESVGTPSTHMLIAVGERTCAKFTSRYRLSLARVWEQ